MRDWTGLMPGAAGSVCAGAVGAGAGTVLDIPCSYRDRSITVAAQNVGHER